MKIKIFRHPQKMADFVCSLWLKSGQEAIKKRNNFCVALCGGKTPVRIYQQLARSSRIRFWPKTHIFLTDERFVAWEHKASNYRMIKKNLLIQKAILKENTHPVRICKTARISAQGYADDLKKSFRLSGGQWPRFDLIILGVGEDGHTASLFPGSSALYENRCLATSVRNNKLQHERITLTMPVINHARQIVFLVMGRQKAEIIRKILLDGVSVPAARVMQKNKNVVFVLDQGSSSLLRTSNGSVRPKDRITLIGKR